MKKRNKKWWYALNDERHRDIENEKNVNSLCFLVLSMIGEPGKLLSRIRNQITLVKVISQDRS